MPGSHGNSPVIPALEPQMELASHSPIYELWVWLWDPASVNKVEKLISDVSLGTPLCQCTQMYPSTGKPHTKAQHATYHTHTHRNEKKKTPIKKKMDLFVLWNTGVGGHITKFPLFCLWPSYNLTLLQIFIIFSMWGAHVVMVSGEYVEARGCLPLLPFHLYLDFRIWTQVLSFTCGAIASLHLTVSKKLTRPHVNLTWGGIIVFS